MPRVKKVNKAQKDQGACEKCGTELPAGSSYIHFKVGFRSRFKRVRCTSPACYPKQSELTASRMADAYAAQEAAHEAIDLADSIEDVQLALNECASAAGEVASGYEDTISETPMLEDQLREKVDALEAWQQELENVDMPEADDEDEETCEHCEGTGVCDAEAMAETDGDKCAEGHGCTSEQCGNCGGAGTISNDDAVEEKLGEAKEIARTAVDSLEA